MGDIWAFLLQTLTASGVAVMLLIVKTMFRDKLSPRWQFAVWSVLGLVLLLPAGWGGRYGLIHWSLLVEAAKTLLTGTYTVTRVTAPIPLFGGAPKNLFDWLFVVYFIGVVFMLLRYIALYIKLRRSLHQGQPVSGKVNARIHDLAQRYQLRTCPAIAVEGISSAFVCGVLHPVLIVPANADVDEKVLLHELMHHKYHDVAWGMLICLFRCIHWCNPLLWYCANRAGNDLEALCDQRVLERLEGEERRDYGRILLSMADEKYARAPGTSSMANGGKNIRERIEAIARFKKYPEGMTLVSVCVVVVLAGSFLIGVRANGVYDDAVVGNALAMASARTTWCTTPAGALDAYAKSFIMENGVYRAMCAPLEMQPEIASELRHRGSEGNTVAWDTGLGPVRQDVAYSVFNLDAVEDAAYQGSVAMVLQEVPQLEEPIGNEPLYAAVQQVRVEREGERWVVIPLTDFDMVQTTDHDFSWGWDLDKGWNTAVYQGTAEDFRVEIQNNKIYWMNNDIEDDVGGVLFAGVQTHFDTVPKPHAEFEQVSVNKRVIVYYEGDPSAKDQITQFAVVMRPYQQGEARPQLDAPPMEYETTSSSNQGDYSYSAILEPGWDSTIHCGGGGSSGDFEEIGFALPDQYAADMYINRKKVAELTLRPQEGGGAA